MTDRKLGTKRRTKGREASNRLKGRPRFLRYATRGFSKVTGAPIIRFCEILPNLYVGEQYRKLGKSVLAKAGIDSTINMRIEFDDREHGLHFEQHRHFPTINDTAPSIDHLLEGIQFIKDVHDGGGKVYIHCEGGMGRAPSMGAAYLMYIGMSMEEALDFLKSKRPFVNLVPEQIEQLKKLELRIRESSGLFSESS